MAAGNGHKTAAATAVENIQQENWMARMYPSSDIEKALMKMPLVLWRMGLGPLMGHVFMVITVTGRTSGLPRRVMTEWHTFDGKKFVPCAFGERAQWYKNIMVDPRVTIQTADGVERVVARRITDDDELRRAYAVGKQRNAPMVEAYLEMLGIDPHDVDDFLAKKERVVWLTFDPTDQPTPPPLAADLTWLWAVIAALLVVGWLLGRAARRRAA